MKFSSLIGFCARLFAVGFLGFCLVFQLSSNPVGFFCDEAEIANVARSFLQAQGQDYFVFPFFYHHFDYVFGLLTAITTIPFMLLGQDEFFTRLTSVVFSLLSLWFISLTLKRLKVTSLIPVVMLGFSPLFFHLSRVNFGHLQSLCATSMGLWLYFLAKEKQRWWLFGLSGLCFALSAYGYTGYQATAPLFVGIMLLGEVAVHRWQLKEYRKFLPLVISFVIGLSPIIFGSFFIPDFSLRLQDKTSELPSGKMENLTRMVLNYPKYFSLDYLFVGGENTQNGSFITRHSVNDNGIFLVSFLPIVLLALFGWFFVKDSEKQTYLPFLLLFFLAPLPDLITTNFGQAPYSIALFHAQLCIPFLTVYAMRTFRLLLNQLQMMHKLARVKTLFIFIVMIDIGVFLIHYFYSYPFKSADYWGWQMGPQQIVRYFSQQQENFDEMFVSPNFNEPEALVNFYNNKYGCGKCLVGTPQENFDSTKKQLFALTSEEVLALAETKIVIHHTVSYPNGTIAFYLVEFPSTQESSE